MGLPVCPEYRWEKLRAIYAAVFVRIRYPFGGRYFEKIAAVQACKPVPFRNIRRFVHLFVLPGRDPNYMDGRALHILRMDGDYYAAWRRAVKAELS